MASLTSLRLPLVLSAAALVGLAAACAPSEESGLARSALGGGGAPPPGACAEDVVDPAAIPGAHDVYFSMPTTSAGELGCRMIASGGTLAAGRAMMALWQQGEAGVATPVTWDVGSVTGLALGSGQTAAAFQRGPNDTQWTSALQMKGDSVGMWINSGQSGVTTTGTILPAVLHYDFKSDAQPKPWSTPGAALVYAFDAQVPTAKSWGDGVPYAAAVFRFRDLKEGNEGRDVWFSIVFFDPRGAPDDTELPDDCSTCSHYPILITTFTDKARYGSLGPGSARFSSEPWAGFRHFDFRVQEADIARAIDRAKTRFKLDDKALSPNPADYALVHVNMNPEVYAPATGGAAIGMSARGVAVGRTLPPSATSTPITRVRINAANGSTTPELQVFFKTAASNFYDERKSLRVPFPLGGANVDVIADFVSHPDWKGTLTGLRIDPFDSHAANACFNVDTVALEGASGTTGATFPFDVPKGTPVAPFDGWSFSGMDRLWNDGRYWGACADASGDPYFFRDFEIPLGR